MKHTWGSVQSKELLIALSRTVHAETRTASNLLAEREGFEPSMGDAHTRFPSVLLRPLGHLSDSVSVGMATQPINPRHPSPLLPLLLSRPGGVHTLSSRGNRPESPQDTFTCVVSLVKSSQKCKSRQISKLAARTDANQVPGSRMDKIRNIHDVGCTPEEGESTQSFRFGLIHLRT